MWCLNVVLFLKMIIRKSKLLLFQLIDLYWSFTVINKLLNNHKKIIFLKFLPGNETQLSFQRKLELDFLGNIFCSSSVIKISFFAISMKQFLWKCTMYMFDQFVQKFIINVSLKFPSTMCRSFWKIIIIRNICDYRLP